MPDTYQFIKYSSDSSIASIAKKGGSGAVICFDLEDSISDLFDEKRNYSIKQEYRLLLNKIIQTAVAGSGDFKIGIRINSSGSGLQDLDIACIPANSKIHSILIPKVEYAADIDTVVEKLKTANILFDEVIPLIESRKGLHNVEEILNSTYKLTKVGFGHCDYNLSIGAFPFFHQDAIEYWKWVSRLLGFLRPRNITFINSAYLNLNDTDFFKRMLSYLKFLCGEAFGQFTLTHQQTLLCADPCIPDFDIKNGIAGNRLNLGVTKEMLNGLISSYENDNKGLGFTISPETGILISPHEYYSAKQHLRNRSEKEVNFTFVGGCFPVQGDILFEDIFHQALRKTLEEKLHVHANVNIIRYEKFSNCLEKIAVYAHDNPVDVLVFHIRPEPFLRLIKLYYKYLDYSNKLCHSLNLPFLKVLNPEKYDLLLLSRRYSYPDKGNRPKKYNVLLNLNYIFGYLIGNQRYALKKYLSLVDDVLDFCHKQHIKVIMLGPALRSEAMVETLFSTKLESFMSEAMKQRNVQYVFGMEKHQDRHIQYFNANGIHAAKPYHDLIARRLHEELEAYIGSLSKAGQ